MLNTSRRFFAGPLVGPNRKKGQVLAVGAVMMLGLIGVAALAVDVGYFYVARNQLQNIADGSALAATRTLGHIYQGLPNQLHASYTCGDDCILAIETAAQDNAANNKAAGMVMSVLTDDVIIGQWDSDGFTPTFVSPDAVQVVARREDGANGAVATFFARILGIETRGVNAVATAALSGQSTAWPGELELPIGISEYFFKQNPEEDWCDKDIQFYPTNDPASCAGWTSWEYGSNDATLRRILEERDGYESPKTVADSSYFAFTGGTLSNPTFDALLHLFWLKGFDVDENWDYLLDEDTGDRIQHAREDQGAVPLYGGVDINGDSIRGEYPDGTPRNKHKWETTVPVYDRLDCSNPNQTIKIIGFAPIEMRDVLNAPNKLVRGIVKCDYVDDLANRGGGGEYGIKGSVPGLVR